jgi:hypothetical protein
MRLLPDRMLNSFYLTDPYILLVYKFFLVLTLSLYFSRDAGSVYDFPEYFHTAVWFFVFFFQTSLARYHLDNKSIHTGPHPYRKVFTICLPLFLLFLISSTIFYPFGSLLLRMLVCLYGFLNIPSAGDIKSGSDILLKVFPMLLYLHYCILSLDMSDERTLWQKFCVFTGLRPILDAYYAKKSKYEYVAMIKSSKRFLIIILLICSAYLTHNYIYFVALGNPDFRNLTSMYFAEREDVFRVDLIGLHKINVYGNFSDGRKYRITESKFGTRYSSSNPAVAIISKGYMLFTLSPGEAVITATNRGFITEWHIRVKN